MLAQKMHVKIPKELDSESFHMMIAIITPENEVQVFNFGTSWAGLFRDGNLIAHTVLQKRQDSSYQYGHSAKPAETIWDVSEHKWQAQPGDLVLSDEPFLKEKDFDLYAMGIVKAARIAAGEQPNNDMFASVIRIGEERDS
ncbi:hypothetical protein METBIDRAFT_14069 [Metschnikowia bicuspidata var. bicuspidata NRRL YB-4993]|uniref:Uncharacterized protein n=1 Tax=Metschnikowia bicuspidata var. bicuspidata NRRL YB-4993 TaxID=869754 RepID=A0A1A0GWP8_9ASCO|nr:hypothetical protein METBIDRAFT_14069 [Metschnikowia bicuspidata var. bicuspidata NRRL YB-4993]OBA16125.1 hypothetical protein METBIDRAFT_14069 [Metschnikowia bicuspidata var. bicuspidata NRRL YB-4993]